MAGKNTEVKIISPKQIFPEIKGLVSSASTFVQGDILVWDSTNKIVRAATGEAEAATVLGIAQQDVSAGVIVSPYQGTAVDAAQGGIALSGPVFGNTFKMVCKTGDSFNPGDYVYAYPAGGNRYVSASGTKPVGVYVGQSAVASAAAGAEIECLIGARFPNDSIKF